MFSLPGERKKILVIGDFIIDHYRMLNPSRVSSEAPVLIFSGSKEEFRFGGAANVAKNLESFGMDVTLCSVIGSEPKMDFGTIKTIFQYSCKKRTTVKERLLSMGQQLMRIDHQDTIPIGKEEADSFVQSIDRSILTSDAVVFSDYAHGTLVPDVVVPIINIAKRNCIPIVVDTKSKDIYKYKGSTIALPNRAESISMLRIEGEVTNEEIASRLLSVMELDAIGLTLGSDGIMLMERTSGPRIFPAYRHDDEVVDVTGAGDTVTAAVAFGLASGLKLDDCMILANVAAGIVVQKLGVATVSPEEINSAFQKIGD